MPKLSELTAHNLTTPSGSTLVLGADQAPLLAPKHNPTFTGNVKHRTSNGDSSFEIDGMTGNIILNDDIGNTFAKTPSINGRTNQIVTQDWIKRKNANIILGEFDLDVNGKLPVELSTGIYNVLLGINSGRSITTGGVNLLMGNGVAPLLTTGWYNVAQGSDTLANIISGNKNVALSASALRYLITGDDNIALGERSGARTLPNDWGSNVTNLNKSIFLGKYAAAKNATGDTNEIVIGYNAQGEGSNTVVLGNNSITDTYLKGKVRASTAMINKLVIRNNFVLNNPSNFMNVLDVSDVNLTSGSVMTSEELIITNNANNNHLLSVGDTFIGDVTIEGDALTGTTFTISSIQDAYELSVWNPFYDNTSYDSTTYLSIIATKYGSIADKTIMDTTDLDRTYNLNIIPKYDSIHSLGSITKKWRNVYSFDLYSHDGAVNTSDSRQKTQITPFTTDEINAAKQLSKEIGTYKWLSAIAEKGDAARKHIGMTVQRAIEIMTTNNLNPMEYGFICYDEWQDKFETIPAVEAKEAWTEEIKGNKYELVITPATEDEPEKQEIVEVEYVVETIEHPAVEAKDAYQVQTGVAGSIYSFRYTELLAFICRGFEERLTALENK